MAHPLTAHLGYGDFNAAFLADDAFVLHPLVLAAQAFVILHRTKDARAEQPVTLGLEGPIVDRLGLFDLAKRPRANTLGGRDPDLDLVKGFWLGQLVGEFCQFVHDLVPLGGENWEAGVGGRQAQCSADPVIPLPPAIRPRRPLRRQTKISVRH